MAAKLPDDVRIARKAARDHAFYMAHQAERIAYANEYGPKWRAAHPEANKAIAKRHRLKVRLEVIAAYGGVCSCCGEANPGFLSIDHINGGGAAHRKSLSMTTAGYPMYSWLKTHGWPEGFRVLCYNCNLGRAFHGDGTCPHLMSPASLSLAVT
jgi:hypothetical protein